MVDEVGPFTLVAWRLLFAGIFLTVVVWIRKAELPRNPSEWLSLTFFGIINTALPFVLISWSEQYIDSAVASVLNGSVPLFTMLIAHLFISDDRMTVARVTALLIGFVGIFMLALQGLLESGIGSEFWGAMAMIAAALGYACGIVYARRNLSKIRPIIQGFVAVWTADAIIWASTFMIESPVVLPELPITWIGLAILGFLGTGLAYVLFFQLIQTIGPTRSTMVTYVAPVVGVVLGVTFLNEPLTWNLVAGTILIVSAVVLINRKSAMAKAVEKEPSTS